MTIISTFVKSKLLFFTIVYLLITGAAAIAQWVNVGTPEFTLGQATNNTIVTSSSGVPYVAFCDNANADKATVMRFDGMSWAIVGSAGFSEAKADYTSIAMAPGDVPYIVFRDFAHDRKASVMKFNGVNWESVGAAGFSAGEATFTTIAINAAGVPYVGYGDHANGGRTTVVKFNGTDWENVGITGFSAGYTEFVKLLISPAGIPYTSFRDGVNGKRVSVMKYDGISWVYEGAAGFTPEQVTACSFAMSSTGTMYVAFGDSLGALQYTMKFDGSSWVMLGTSHPGQCTFGDFIFVDGYGNPYVLYQDENLKLAVLKYDGISWAAVGSSGFSPTAIHASLTISPIDNQPYVVYANYPVSMKATVMKFVNTSGVGATRKTSENPLVSPNPSNGIFSIRQNDVTNKERLLIISDASGAKISEQIFPPEKDLNISISLSPGVYFATLISDGRTSISKILIY